MRFLEKFWTGCGHCHGGESCPIAQAFEQESSPYAHGHRLVLSVLTIFILPLLTAILTAFAAGKWFGQETAASLGRWQTGGLLVGLAVGVGLAKLLIYIATRPRQSRPSSDYSSTDTAEIQTRGDNRI